ncbi:hypothetical protein E4U53_006148 [Claviceps sorghi]|nr:hypothetical protein E4U53_006148 [Claviceps sorghi]
MLEDEVAPEGGDVDLGRQALVCFWVMAAVSTIVVALRFLGRHFRRRIGLDDWLMLVTLILHLLFVAILTKIILLGGLRHIYYLGQDERVQMLKWTWICQPFVVMGFAMGKLSIGVLLYRVVGSASFWRKWLLCVALALALLFSVITVALTYAQCSRLEALWNRALVAEGKATCWSPTVQLTFALFLSGWNIMVDVFLAVLPATFFCRLNLTLKKKIGLCALLGLGSLAAICAAVKTKYLYSLTTPSDLAQKTYHLYIWSAMELFLIINCGSIAPIKPVYDRLLGQPARSSSSADATGYRRCDASLDTPKRALRSSQPGKQGLDRVAEEEVELDCRRACGAMAAHSGT